MCRHTTVIHIAPYVHLKSQMYNFNWIESFRNLQYVLFYLLKIISIDQDTMALCPLAKVLKRSVLGLCVP
jgi:hypothetical protein